MKKHILTLLAFFLALGCMAQDWNDTGSERPVAPETILLSSSDDQIIIQFHLGGFFSHTVNTPQGPQVVVSAPEMFAALVTGTPDLPHMPIPVIIGDAAEMEVSVTESAFIDYEGIEIAPSKGNLSRQIDPETVPYTYGEMYDRDAFYPATPAGLEAPYIMRDFRGQNIMVMPFAYNPVSKTLRVYTKMTLTMTRVSDDGENPKTTRKSDLIKMDSEIRQAYHRRFINFGQTKYGFVEDCGTMLVICPDPYLDAMQPFVDWKNQSGRPTTMVSLSEIGGNNKELIKAYIQDRYENEGLTYVLLVGDYADITPYSMGNNGSSDNWFGRLEGTDNYIEVFVGRFSVESLADVENHVSKVIYYERDLLTGITWGDHGVGIGATDGDGIGHNGGELDWEHMDFIRDTLLHYTYSDITRRYKGINNPTAADLTNDFNAGASIVNYCNHGSETSWLVCSYSNSHVNALTNDYRWPAIISTACLNGKFNASQPCFAETWMRATNEATGVPTGAIGGMFSWSTQPWAPPMTGQDEMNAILAEWCDNDAYNHTMAGTFLNGNMKILDAHPSDAGITHNTWILFGDPSLLLRTANPTSLNVDYSPEMLMPGISSLIVNADAPFGIATLCRDGEVLASGYLHDGSVTLHFDPIVGQGTTRLTVIGYNKETFVRDIDIASLDGPYIIYDSHSVNDANGQLDYNESSGIDVTVKNIGIAAANDVTVNLISESDYVSVVNGNAHINTLEAGERLSIEDLFSVHIANNVPNKTRATMRIDCTQGESIWSSNFIVMLNAPSLTLTDAYTIGDVEPGMSGTLRVILANEGDSPSQVGRLEIFCGNEGIGFNNNAVAFPVIQAGETYNLDIPFNVSEDALSGTAIEVDFYATAGLYSTSGKVLISIGNVKEDFETGDFTKFNWLFSGGDWTIVSDEVHTGNYAARSAQITNNHSTDMILTLDVQESGEITFWTRTSSESYCDKLHFYIDNDEQGTWSGVSQDWEKTAFPITAGFHLLRWVYSKDASSSYGQDCAWVDDIQFPPAEIASNLPAIEDLQVYVDGNRATLHWKAIQGYSYLIRRNGIQIAQQSQNEYTETLADGIYSYCIIATDGQGHYSEPSCVTVEVGLLNLESLESAFVLYPNPVSNTLHIECNGIKYHYAIFNAMGQLMTENTAHGDSQINVETWSTGVYLIRLTSGMQTSIQKIVVE